MKKAIFVFILLIISALSLIAQDKPEERIKTSDGNIYVGEVVMETEDIVKIVIGKRTIVNIEKSKIVLRELANNRIRNHTISGELSNFYLLASGINYDVNLYRRDNYVLGGTLSAGLVGVKVGSYSAYRLSWQDLLKAEVGLGIATQWATAYSGPYVELGYRSQRDSRWFYWELSVGTILDLADSAGALRYASVGLGVSF